MIQPRLLLLLTFLILCDHGAARDRGAFFDTLEKRTDLSFLRGKAGQPYVHFFAAEAEYGAFYSMPMLAEMLNKRHGFTVSISYSLDREGHIDSRVKEGLTGFDLLEHADLLVVFTRSKYLTKKTAVQFQKYLDSGKPLVGFRTANHGFNFSKDAPDADFLRAQGWTHKGPQLFRMWKHKFGGHHGGSPKDGMLTAISPNPKQADHPILRGVKPYQDPRHLYILLNEPGKEQYDFTPLVHGRALKIFDHKKNLPHVQPTVILSEKPRRTVYSSTCGADTFKNPNARRLALQGILWALRLEDRIPAAGVDVDFFRAYQIPKDTHLREGDPHRGRPAKVFAATTAADDYQMVLMPAADKAKRLAMLADTHMIKGGSESPNRQPPVEYPYLNIYQGKENSLYQNHTEYQPKLHQFYARQGRFYLKNPDRRKAVVPAHPGLDANIHGHSGTYHKNGMRTGVRDAMEQGNVIQYIDGHGLSYGLYLDRAAGLMLVYDAKQAVPRQLFAEAAVDYDDYRMSTSRSAKVVGQSRFTLAKNGWGEQKLHFNGHYRYETSAVFSYTVERSHLLEFHQVHGHGTEAWLSQHFYAPKGHGELTYQLGALTDATLEQSGTTTFLSWKDGDAALLVGIRHAQADRSGKLQIGASQSPRGFSLSYWRGSANQLPKIKRAMAGHAKALDAVAPSLPAKTQGSPAPQWNRVFVGHGQLANPKNFKTPYVIDTLPVPIVNPYRSPMVLSGIAFNPKGEAYVATMFGDIWKVTGIDHDLKQVKWKRMIAGLNSPFGLTYHDGVLYAGDKAELIALHDLNGDAEFDFVERVNQAFVPMHRNVHAGAPRDSQGAFYYVTAGGVKKLYNNTVTHLSPATRTAMGIGVTHGDRVWSAPQEGGWTPASAIFEHHDGDDVYRPDSREHQSLEQIRKLLDPALVYIPRGIDNSTGGFATVRSTKFGPLGDKMLCLSYGACSSLLVLRDKPAGANRFQGAVIPMEGNFISGLRYGKASPVDGQVYVVGHDGWGTYAVSDGCLQRIRYTGQPAYYPVAFRTYQNGVKLTYAEPFDEASARDVANLFVQQWNYKYSNAYGSPEFSVKSPDQEGHDVLTVKSAHLLDDRKTLFIELPHLAPAMTIHVYGQLKSADLKSVELNIFMTALHLEKPFTAFPGYKKSCCVADAQVALDLPVMIVGLKDKPIHASVRAKSITITTTINDQMQFIFDAANQKKLEQIKQGDSIIFRIQSNASTGGTQHNALVINKADTETIGNFCDKTAASLEAKQNSYVPRYNRGMAAKVLAHSTLITPMETKEFVYLAQEKGEKTLICTFPGHWRLMRTDFTVR